MRNPAIPWQAFQANYILYGSNICFNSIHGEMQDRETFLFKFGKNLLLRTICGVVDNVQRMLVILNIFEIIR